MKSLCKIFFLFFLVCSCATSPQLKDRFILKELGLVPYQPTAYESIVNDPGVVPIETYQLCTQQFDKLSYRFYSLTYKSDGLNVKAIVGLPPDLNMEQAHPLLVFNRGGNRNFGFITVCNFQLLQDFAYTVPNSVLVLSQYRGSHESEGQDEFGGRDINDIINLIGWTKHLSFIDPSRHYLAGWSRGGMMSYLVLRNKISFKAAAIIAGPTDLISMEKHRTEMAEIHKELIPNYDHQRRDVLKERSAIFWPEKIDSPLLIIHGTDDSRVSVKDSQKMSKLLTKYRKIHRYVEYQGDDHDLSHSYKNALDEIRVWFRTYK